MKHAITTAAAALLLVSCSGGDKAGNEAAISGDGNAAASAGGTESSRGGATAELSPGQWETTVEILRMDMGNVPGMPAGMTPPRPAPTTVRSCLTPQQARRPNAGFMAGNNEAGCAYENFSMAGGRVQGTMTCNQQGSTVRATVNGSFSPESYRMESDSQVNSNGVSVSTTTRVTGRRIGDCPG